MTSEEAIDILSDFSKQIAVKADGAYERDTFVEAKKLAIESIRKQIPEKVSEEDVNQWILWKDRLPKIPKSLVNEGFHRVEVIATIKDSDVPVQLVWFDIENNEFYDDWDWFASKFNKEDILAWQPLPQPYKGGSVNE